MPALSSGSPVLYVKEKAKVEFFPSFYSTTSRRYLLLMMMLRGTIVSQKYWAIFRSTKEMKMEKINIIGIEIKFIIEPFMNKGFTFFSINL